MRFKKCHFKITLKCYLR